MPNISQIELVAAISKHLDKRGCTLANTRQMNAIIKAADLIVEEFAREHVPAKPNMGLRAWLACDDTGASSLYLARILGVFAGEPDALRARVPDTFGDCPAPQDPDDFGRCVRLLEAVPELAAHLPEMAASGPEWAALVGAWAELEAMYLMEVSSGKCPLLYERMKALRAADKETDTHASRPGDPELPAAAAERADARQPVEAHEAGG